MSDDAIGIHPGRRGVEASMSVSFGLENMPVEVGSLRVGSELVIRTRNTEYIFVLSDPSARLGLLSGGSRVEAQEAVLACAVSGDGDSTRSESGLRVGSRAVFYLFVDGCTKTLMTSAICELRAA
jgi:hypothetical protein